MTGHLRALTARRADQVRSQSGMTLLELLLAMAVSALIIGPVCAWAILVLGQQGDARSQLDIVNSTGRLNAYVARDVASAARIWSTSAGGDCTGGGAGQGPIKLQLVPAGADRRIVYTEAPASNPKPASARSLWRRVCNDSGALTSSSEVVRNISAGSTQVSCPGDNSAPDPCTVDSNRLVSIQVTPVRPSGASSRVMQLQATRRTMAASTGSPTPANRHPLAQFTISPRSGYGPTAFKFNAAGSVDFDGTIASYHWSFPPGASCSSSGGDAVQTCTFTGTGDRLVQLTVTDNGGATNSAADTVTILNRFPVANAAVSPASGEVGSTPFTFSAAGSGDPDGGALNFKWDLGEDMAPGSRYLEGASPTFTFPAGTPGGLRQVTLIVTDANGDNDASIVLVRLSSPGGSPTDTGTQIGDVVVSPALVAGSGLPRLPDPVGNALPGRTVTFSPSQPLPTGATTTWELRAHNGTAAIATSNSVSFTYTFGAGDAGEYDVVRTVHPASGPDVASPTVSFRVNAAPVAAFTLTGSGDAPRTITLDSSGSQDAEGPIVSYRWSFGFFGNWTSTNPNPTWTLTNPGTYTIALLVVDSDGAQSLTTRTVTITGTPPAPPNPTWNDWTLSWNPVAGATSYRVTLVYPCTTLTVTVDPDETPSTVAAPPSQVCGAPGTVYGRVETENNRVYSTATDNVPRAE